jgi:hypothetical protein
MGVALRPFSIGAYLLMKKYEIVYAEENPNTPITIGDLVMSILICSRTFDDFISLMQSENCLTEIKNWGKCIDKEIRNNPNYFCEKSNMFVKYMEDGMKTPKYWVLANDDDRSGSSNKLMEHIITTLQGQLGYQRSETLNCSYRQALYDYLLYLEQKGVIQIMNDGELSELEEGSHA